MNGISTNWSFNERAQIKQKPKKAAAHFAVTKIWCCNFDVGDIIQAYTVYRRSSLKMGSMVDRNELVVQGLHPKNTDNRYNLPWVDLSLYDFRQLLQSNTWANQFIAMA